MREIVFDTETTGLSAASGDRLVEIGCIELINRTETGRVYHAYYNPERPMDPVAQSIHGLSDAFLSDKPVFDETVEDLLDFLDDSPLIAHNASFDFAFLNHELGACGRLKIPMSRMIDTLAIARVRHPGAKHSLDALCTRYGIDRSHRVKHGALLDAQLLSQLYVELTGGRQIGLELAGDVGMSSTPVFATRAHGAGKTPRTPRVFTATPQELAIHSAFIEKLIDPLWGDSDTLADQSTDVVVIDVRPSRA